jgi:hypothetical protein
MAGTRGGKLLAAPSAPTERRREARDDHVEDCRTCGSIAVVLEDDLNTDGNNGDI